MTTRLIVNADDFGQTREINKGIKECMEKGIVTSTTFLVNFSAFNDAVRIAKKMKNKSFGLHINLIEGKALSGVSSLTDEKGNMQPISSLFPKTMLGLIEKEDILKEIRLQVKKLKAAGIKISHVDSHQHTHMFPFILPLVLQVMKEFKINKLRFPKEPLFTDTGSYLSTTYLRKLMLTTSSQISQKMLDKVKYTDTFMGMSVIGSKDCKEEILRNLRNIPENTTCELLCHPGYNSKWLEKTCRHNKDREKELKALTSKEAKSILKRKKIKLINYHDL